MVIAGVGRGVDEETKSWSSEGTDWSVLRDK